MVSPFGRVKTYMELIKVEHTVFALPFALTSALVAAKGIPTVYQLLWISTALFGARTAAMSLNRAFDAEIDAKNPRTAERHIPKGIVKKAEAYALAVLGFGVMVFSAYKLNKLALELSPLAILILTAYSFTKRFTLLCHLILGTSVALAPLGAWVAVRGNFSFPAFLLFFAVAFWIAGFDIIYALQDVEFDRKEGLHSIPAKLGKKKALFLSKTFHFITLACLLLLGLVQKLGILYFLGIGISAAFMVKEHTIVSKDETKIGYAFFNLNGYISLTVFFFTLLDFLAKGRT